MSLRYSKPFSESFAGRDVCRLVTPGRVSGRPHDIEIWFGVDDGRIYFISGNGPGADWYRNALYAGEARAALMGRRGRAGPGCHRPGGAVAGAPGHG